jgi:hypothetical protein
MLIYCSFILCLATDWLIERSDRIGMNAVVCLVEERTFCPYPLWGYPYFPSEHCWTSPWRHSGRSIQLISHIHPLQILIMHVGLSPSCLHGTVFTHEDYHRFELVDFSAHASIMTQFILRVSSDFCFVGSGFYIIPFLYIIVVVVVCRYVSVKLRAVLGPLSPSRMMGECYWSIGLVLIDSGKRNFKEINLSLCYWIHHKFHTNCSGIEAGFSAVAGR